MSTTTPHPYHPPTLSLSGYVEPTLSTPTLFACISLPLATILTLTASFFPKRVSFPSLWFLQCGLLHTIFEGYFIAHRHELVGSQELMAQLWKHYALSDSRYLINDPFMVSAETLTVFVLGPLCFLAFVVSLGPRAGPGMHILRIVISTCHLFSCGMYYVTEMVEGFVHCRPEPVYKWGYMVAMNMPWIIVPLFLVWGSVKALMAEEGKRKTG